MHHLVLKDMPERYRLSFDPETASLRVIAHKDVRTAMTELFYA